MCWWLLRDTHEDTAFLVAESSTCSPLTHFLHGRLGGHERHHLRRGNIPLVKRYTKKTEHLELSHSIKRLAGQFVFSVQLMHIHSDWAIHQSPEFGINLICWLFFNRCRTLPNQRRRFGLRLKPDCMNYELAISTMIQAGGSISQWTPERVWLIQ